MKWIKLDSGKKVLALITVSTLLVLAACTGATTTTTPATTTTTSTTTPIAYTLNVASETGSENCG